MCLAEGKPKLLRTNFCVKFSKAAFHFTAWSNWCVAKSQSVILEKNSSTSGRSPTSWKPHCWKASSSVSAGNDERAAFCQSVFLTSTDAHLHHCTKSFLSVCSKVSLPVGWPVGPAEQSVALKVSLSSPQQSFPLLHSLQFCWNLIMNQTSTFFVSFG